MTTKELRSEIIKRFDLHIGEILYNHNDIGIYRLSIEERAKFIADYVLQENSKSIYRHIGLDIEYKISEDNGLNFRRVSFIFKSKFLTSSRIVEIFI